MTIMNDPASSDLIVRERDILTRIAAGGPLKEVLRDLVLMVEKPAGGEMLASVLFVSPDGKHLWEGAAPSLPAEYNEQIHGIPIGPAIGSCGSAAFHGRPIIVSDISTDPLWKDFKDLALKHDLRACWSMPITAADGTVLGTFANYYRDPKIPNERDMEIISMVARTTAIAIERHRNELARIRDEEQRTLLLRELDHRVKNVFSLTSALLALGARTSTSAKELADSTQARIRALGEAHSLVRPAEGQASSPSFKRMVETILAPYDQSRINLDGPDFQLHPKAVSSLALVLHELATNAVKYGCLKSDGELSVQWTIADGKLKLVWDESGYECTKPTRAGLGTTLTKAAITKDFKGSLKHDWKSDGVEIEIEVPLGEIAAK